MPVGVCAEGMQGSHLFYPLNLSVPSKFANLIIDAYPKGYKTKKIKPVYRQFQRYAGTLSGWLVGTTFSADRLEVNEYKLPFL